MPEREQTSTDVRPSGTEAVARRYFELISEHDFEAAGALWEPGALDRLPGHDLVAPGDIVEYFSGLVRAFPDFRFEVLEQVTEGDRSVARWRITGTFDGEGSFEGLEPNGSRVELEGADVAQVRDDRVVSNLAYFDSAEVARQLGALPPRGSLAERGMTAALNLRTRVAARLRR